MKKIKDLIYDFNDIFLAIIIIAAAAAIIFWKVSDIMAYPTYSKGDTQANTQTQVSLDDLNLEQTEIEDINANPGELNSEEENQAGENNDSQQSESEQTPSGTDTAPQTPSTGVKKDVTVVVPAGSSSGKIGQILADQGLIPAADDFSKKAVEMKRDTKLKAGTFTIPAGSTVEDIVNIISK